MGGSGQAKGGGRRCGRAGACGFKGFIREQAVRFGLAGVTVVAGGAWSLCGGSGQEACVGLERGL